MPTKRERREKIAMCESHIESLEESIKETEDRIKNENYQLLGRESDSHFYAQEALAEYKRELENLRDEQEYGPEECPYCHRKIPRGEEKCAYCEALIELGKSLMKNG